MTTYSTMLDFFTPDKPRVEKACIDCESSFEVNSNQDWRTQRCPTCSMLHQIEVSRKKYNKINPDEDCTGFAAIDIIKSLILFPIEDARNGDTEAREFLRAEDGAVLYLRIAGVEVDAEMRRRLYWIGKKRNAETRGRMTQ